MDRRATARSLRIFVHRTKTAPDPLQRSNVYRRFVALTRRNLKSPGCRGFVLLQVFRMTMAGVTIGVAASFGLTRLLSAQLFGVKPSDPLTFAAVPVILIAVALAAAFIPALRATRVDPLEALRHD